MYRIIVSTRSGTIKCGVRGTTSGWDLGRDGDARAEESYSLFISRLKPEPQPGLERLSRGNFGRGLLSIRLPRLLSGGSRCPSVIRIPRCLLLLLLLLLLLHLMLYLLVNRYSSLLECVESSTKLSVLQSELLDKPS